MLLGPHRTTRSPGTHPGLDVRRRRWPRRGAAGRRRTACARRLDVRRVVAEPLRGSAEQGGQGLQTKHLLGRVPNVDLSYSAEDEAFRAEIRGWLEEHLTGDFAALKGLGGPGQDHEAIEERLAWNRHLAEHGWTGVGWPAEHGGRGLSLWQQVIFHEEYARSDAPARVNHVGEELLGPTLMAFGTEEQKQRFLPEDPGRRGALGAGLLRARRRLRPGQRQDQGRRSTADEWVVDGQKVWTSNAHFSQWVFVIARTEPGSRPPPGPVVPARADRPGRRRRPADRAAHRRLGVQRGLPHRRAHRRRPGRRRARPGLGRRDGAARLRARRLDPGAARRLRPRARRPGRPGAQGTAPSTTRCCATGSPALKAELEVMRFTALRSLSRVTGGEDSSAGGGAASIFKLAWASWHKRLGEVAMDVLGAGGPAGATGAPYDLDEWQRLFLFSRADSIYGGSDEVQRNILAERVLGLPREPKGTAMTHPPTRAADPRLRPRARPARRQGRRGHRGRRCRHRRLRRPARARGGRQGGRLQRHPRAPARRGRGGAGRASSAPTGCASWSAT